MMEIKTEIFEQALNFYSDVAKANIATKIASDLQEKMHMRSLKEEHEGNYDPEVLFSKELNLKVNASKERDPLWKEKTVLTKAEVTFSTFHNYDNTFCSFYLTLNLHSHQNILSFCVARTQDEENKYYLVHFLEKQLKLQQGDNTEVDFSSKEDMQLILDFCKEVIATFNAKVGTNYQLVHHFEVFK